MYIYFILFINILFSGTDKGADWELRKDKSGIEVYTRSVENSSFDEFKAITTLTNTSLTKVLDVILDIENFTNLYPDCIEAKILEQKGKYYDIHYFKIKAPWPVKNRDAIYESVSTVADNGNYARVNLEPLGNYLPEKKDIVRMHKGRGFWELEATDTNTVKVLYQFHGDPGGKVPAWLANSSVTASPFHTLMNMKKILKEY